MTYHSFVTLEWNLKCLIVEALEHLNLISGTQLLSKSDVFAFSKEKWLNARQYLHTHQSLFYRSLGFLSPLIRFCFVEGLIQGFPSFRDQIKGGISTGIFYYFLLEGKKDWRINCILICQIGFSAWKEWWTGSDWWLVYLGVSHCLVFDVNNCFSYDVKSLSMYKLSLIYCFRACILQIY